jgi:SAM-dependent methyltransferase
MEKLNFFKLLLNRIYYLLFVENFKKKLNFKFPENIFRYDLMQHIINKYNFTDYLEIGCDKNQTFSKINIKNKVGVDPISGGTIRDTSDNFFVKNTNKFDIIFIDGLHHYDQVTKDIQNSLKILNTDGFILIHDCLPRTMAQQAVPRYRGSWNGDVWKSIVKFRTRKDLNIFTCEIDFGIAIITKENNSRILELSMENFKNLKFKDYYYNHQEFMNIISYQQALEVI